MPPGLKFRVESLAFIGYGLLVIERLLVIGYGLLVIES